MKLIVTGGGTGGHIQPIVALVEHLRSLGSPWEILWLGSKNGLEKEIAVKKNIEFVSIPCGKFRRYGSIQNFVDLFKIPFGVIKAILVILRFKPNVVFGKGGYVSLPTIIAAFLMRKSILIHESDVIPGLSNKILSRLADRVAISFKDSETDSISLLSKLISER